MLPNTEVPRHPSLRAPTAVSPSDVFCPFSRSQPSFAPENSKVLSEETSCPTSQQPPLLAPCVFSPIFLSFLPITFHPTLWMPRTSATPSEPQTRQEKNEGITFLHAVTQRVDFCISNSISLLLLPAAEPCLPACHPFSSILLQTQQSIICFLSLRHCQHATRQDGSNSSRYSSWPAVSPSLCATANARCPQLRSLSSSSAPSSEGVFIF